MCKMYTISQILDAYVDFSVSEEEHLDAPQLL